ncbi:hypothetical protein I312_101493 [Cryptococcus bacillisporus CA1280]|uniref:Uncharacterized protein n=3 Tax=Cryptococcus gattii species complex TaxID=1884637 RepID=A0A0D0VGT5_CRYGA|nr:hypothetical protein I312_04103 [Cryptococcus bacillisporus CA1280]KIR59845.1 hypothetical protein I314_04280 [Cryptococcus bacillisporus CA1873]|eukprot:KIR59845.1 hypothetical protein I314_04280 [Cryptococcus gattii CA1873]
MGNGAKAQAKRDRNTKAAAGKGDQSQLKSNAAAMTIQCVTCKAVFQGTSKQLVLQQHVDSKHPKSDIKTCFPTFAVA